MEEGESSRACEELKATLRVLDPSHTQHVHQHVKTIRQKVAED